MVNPLRLFDVATTSAIRLYPDDPDVARMSDLSTKSSMSCPRCRAAMEEVVRIEPTMQEKGLIAYECPNCVYVTSVLLEPIAARAPSVRRRRQ
jgi:transposase-like protein